MSSFHKTTKKQMQERYDKAVAVVQDNPGISWDKFATKMQLVAWRVNGRRRERNSTVMRLINDLSNAGLIRCDKRFRGNAGSELYLYPIEKEGAA